MAWGIWFHLSLVYLRGCWPQVNFNQYQAGRDHWLQSALIILWTMDIACPYLGVFHVAELIAAEQWMDASTAA